MVGPRLALQQCRSWPETPWSLLLARLPGGLARWAQERNLDILLRETTGLPVMLAEDPLTAVVLGTGRCLDELHLLKEVTVRSQ